LVIRLGYSYYKQKLTDMISKLTLDRLADNKSLSAQEIGSLLGDLANGKMNNNKKEIAEYIADREHRYIQHELFMLVAHLIDAYAEKGNLGRFDGRNMWACKLAVELKKTKDDFRLEM
jgi:hypothetical protein